MSSQINFYMDTQTQDQFIKFISECGFSALNDDATEVIADAESTKSMHLYKKSYGDLVSTKWRESGNPISNLYSPVIDFTKTSVNQESPAIFQGRLWVEPKYYSEDGALVEKDGALMEDYQRLVQWIEKNVPCRMIPVGAKNNMSKEYASESLDELCKNGFSYKHNVTRIFS